jgi:anaerobic magnesium-protoporphyrin IX monomethyl ester cyclase
MNELFLFVRPPRPLWPFNGPGSAFWPPLGFASLAAALRDERRDLRVGILDAPALRMGWRTLKRTIRRLKPAYLGIGEEAASCAEGLRLAALAKESGALVVAGGCFFGNLAPEILATGLVDVVVHGEGERTIVELVPALRTGRHDDLRAVRGISFAAGGATVFTGPRPLIDDLDTLPLPAYDLLPVERYGRTSRNHPHLAAIELSRGCTSACEFCVLWRQMGRLNGSKVRPHLRAKSPDRLLEEIRILAERFGRRYLGWVDPCFNADPIVPGQLAELLLRNELRIGQSAWARAEGIVRDAASGSLARCVEAGLNEVYIGIERPDEAGLRAFKKGSRNGEARKALRLLARTHPEVFTVGSFIYGLPGDTAETIRAMYRLAHELDLDMTFYIPLTPLPGTPYWRPELWDPTGRAFRSFDFLPQVNGDPALARLTGALYRCFALSWPAARLRWLARGLTSRNPRRRSITRRHALRGLRFAAEGMARAIRGERTGGAMRYPSWYER